MVQGTRLGKKGRQKEGNEAQTPKGDGGREGGALTAHALWCDVGVEMLEAALADEGAEDAQHGVRKKRQPRETV